MTEIDDMQVLLRSERETKVLRADCFGTNLQSTESTDRFPIAPERIEFGSGMHWYSAVNLSAGETSVE
jgi:hypothetical protein